MVMIFKMKKTLIIIVVISSFLIKSYAGQNVRILLSHKNAPITFKGSFDIIKGSKKI